MIEPATFGFSIPAALASRKCAVMPLDGNGL